MGQAFCGSKAGRPLGCYLPLKFLHQLVITQGMRWAELRTQKTYYRYSTSSPKGSFLNCNYFICLRLLSEQQHVVNAWRLSRVLGKRVAIILLLCSPLPPSLPPFSFPRSLSSFHQAPPAGRISVALEVCKRTLPGCCAWPSETRAFSLNVDF